MISHPTMPTLALLAGGLATSLKAVTETTPKALVKVAGDPFIAHQLRLIIRERVERVVICTGHLSEQIESYVGDGRAFGIEVDYSCDGPTLLGTGGAIRKALPLLGETFLVLHGDSYLDTEFPPVVGQFRSSGKLGLMTVFCNRNRWDRSNVDFADGVVRRYDKLNPTREMAYIDYGLVVFQRAAFDGWTDNEAFDLGDVYQQLVGHGELAGYEVHERFYEIGSPQGIADTEAYLRARRAV